MEKKKDSKKVKRFINLMHMVADTCRTMDESDYVVYSTLILLQAVRQSTRETMTTLLQGLFDLEEHMNGNSEVAIMEGYINDFKPVYGK